MKMLRKLLIPKEWELEKVKWEIEDIRSEKDHLLLLEQKASNWRKPSEIFPVSKFAMLKDLTYYN